LIAEVGVMDEFVRSDCIIPERKRQKWCENSLQKKHIDTTRFLFDYLMLLKVLGF